VVQARGAHAGSQGAVGGVGDAEDILARYVRLIQEDLLINPLIRHQNPTENAQIACEITNLIGCLRRNSGRGVHAASSGEQVWTFASPKPLAQ